MKKLERAFFASASWLIGAASLAEMASAPEEFGKLIKADYDRFVVIVHNAKIKIV
jgi:hypothetical protein